jgi:mono/diheme cytochrome c family protein
MPTFVPAGCRLRVLVPVLALAALGACTTPETVGDRPAAAVAAASADPRVVGPQVYLRRCSVCHGERGDGFSHARSALSMSPRDFTSDRAQLELTREYMIAIVRDGRPGTPMVGRAQQLSQFQIEAVVDYVRAALMPPDPATPAGQGRQLYRAWCSSCHGQRGEGGPVRAGIRRAPEVSLARPGSTLGAERLLASMGNEMHLTALEGRKLSDAERQAVLAYVRQAFVEPLGSTASRQAAPGMPVP